MDLTTKTCSVSKGGLPEGFVAIIDITYDFEGVSKETERGWAMSHLVIGSQRVLKKMTTAELNELVKTGYHVRALDAGKQAADPKAAYNAKFASMTESEQNRELAELRAMMKNVKGEKE